MSISYYKSISAMNTLPPGEMSTKAYYSYKYPGFHMAWVKTM